MLGTAEYESPDVKELLPVGRKRQTARSFFLNLNQPRWLRRSLASVSPKINRSLLCIAINLIQLRIRELEFSNRIEGVVELFHITSSDERCGDPFVT